MYRSVLKSVSAIAMLAATGTVLSVGAQAADLGGNCCADLEERVAELEATTARKGNRKVSLQVSGKVSETLMYWNDGAEKNTYVQENYNIKNTLQFSGNANINSDFSAGFRLELGIRSYRSSAANQLSLGENNGVTITAYNTQSVALRQANWYIDSKTYGRITVGRTNDAASGTVSVNLANPDGFADAGTNIGYLNNGMFYRRKGAGFTGNQGLSGLTFGDVGHFRNGDGPSGLAYSETGSQIKYTSPYFLGQTKSSGFNVEGSWGQDDFWSAALRYVEDFGAIRFAAAGSYSDWRSLDRGACSQPGNFQANGSGATTTLAANAAGGVSNTACQGVSASASAMHVPTGLYVSGGYGKVHDSQRQISTNMLVDTTGKTRRDGVKGDDSLWWVQAGWEAKLNAFGKTTFWGMYHEYNLGTGVRNNQVQTVAATDQLNSMGVTALLANAKSNIWGLGVTQAVEAAAMNLYAGYFIESTSLTLMRQSNTAIGVAQSSAVTAKSNAIADFGVFYGGATIRF